MTKTVHGLDADGSPISMTFAGDCKLFIEGSFYESEIVLRDEDGNEETFVIEMVDGGPLVRPRRPR